MPDHDRPLNERGKVDAPRMAIRLREKGIAIDQFVSSSARRARKTAITFAKEYDRRKEDVQLTDQLYEAMIPDFLNVVQQLDDAASVVALFSHNPGITDFANSLTNARIDNIPTCGVFAIEAASNSWKEFPEASKTFLFFDYPKSV